MEILIPAAVVGLAVLVWGIVTYNRFVRLRNHIRESWSDIDVELKRRYELIPNLVATVKGYARHEREVLEKVVELRDRASRTHGSAASQAVAETAMLLGLKTLFAVVESYPELKSDAHFLALQKELSLTEDRIAASRRFYNGNVRDINQLCQSFPTSLVASAFGFGEASFFDLENEAERVVPKLEISS